MQAGRHPAAQGFRAVIGGALQGRRTSQPLAGSVITASRGTCASVLSSMGAQSLFGSQAEGHVDGIPFLWR